MTMDKGRYEAGIYRMGDVRIMDRSAEKRLPIGYDGFETVADRSLFVDKSLLVADILGGNYPITLFCRPRRFGKTLAMTMLKAFFEIPVDGIDKAPLFEGLAIWDACDGRYPGPSESQTTIFFHAKRCKAAWEGATRPLRARPLPSTNATGTWPRTTSSQSGRGSSGERHERHAQRCRVLSAPARPVPAQTLQPSRRGPHRRVRRPGHGRPRERLLPPGGGLYEGLAHRRAQGRRCGARPRLPHRRAAHRQGVDLLGPQQPHR